MTIPTMLTSFIGRKREIAAVRRSLQSSRLITLTGAAGCGKTRLALRTSEDSRDQFADGIFWIELARLTDPQFVLPALARKLNVPETPDRSLEAGLLDALQDKRLLLVLDNCEHLLGACNQLVEILLKIPEVRVLATSREPLGVNGEMLYPVAPLSLPSPIFSAEDTGEIDKYDAVQLFVERARAILPPFELTTENASVVAGICRQLDGIPLAIELAAACVNVLTVEQIAARLDNRFELLAAAEPVSASHHQTLRAAIDWSYALLSEPEQMMLRRLAVFSGGCSLTTAEIVCAGDGLDREHVLELLSSLIKKSLLAAETLQRSEARYALLETIREYGREQLTGLGEWASLRERHLQCFLELTEETDPKLRGPYQQLWLSWLDMEYDNIRAALAWSLEEAQRESARVSAGLRIATALYQYWRIRDYMDEGLNWSERLIEAASDEISPVVRANALSYASLLAGVRGHKELQRKYGEQAIALSELAGEEGKPALAMALGALAYSAWETDDPQTAMALARRLLKLYRELDESYLVGVSLSLFSPLAISLGEYREARAMLDEALPLLRETGDMYRISMALNAAGDLARCEKNFPAAESVYQESIALLREIEAVRDLASVLHNLGHVRLHLGDSAEAEVLFRESLALHQDQKNTLGMAECLLGFAALAILSDLPAPGARLLAAAAAHGGKHITMQWVATRQEYEHYLARAQTGLSALEFQIAQEAGGRLSLDEAVAYAQQVAQEAAGAHKAYKQLDELTPREREVAALIARARSNGEIAEQLVVSKRTVETHIANIRAKLGFTERAQIVRWAIETGLVD